MAGGIFHVGLGRFFVALTDNFKPKAEGFFPEDGLMGDNPSLPEDMIVRDVEIAAASKKQAAKLVFTHAPEDFIPGESRWGENFCVDSGFKRDPQP